MIVFQLRCGRGHEFEAWFRNGATFDRQAKAGDIDCPFCADARIVKAPMAPNLGRGVGKERAAPEKADQAPAEAAARAKATAEQMAQTVAKLRSYVEENCDYMGDEFAAEARRIHCGDAEARGIYGEATRQEAKDLKAEGIPVWPLPMLPRRND
jgi:hypothetical protein